jgi:hypothetical protein
MMRSGFQPTRRNRNIGTAKQGRSSDNKMRIPNACGLDRTWFEQLGRHEIVEKVAGGRQVKFIVENTTAGAVHVCSPEKICAVLEQVPHEDWEGLDCFLLRQPTRKQRLLSPVWGRLVMYAEIGQAGKPNVYVGPAVVIEAMHLTAKVTWNLSLDPQAQRELDRLRQDGHRVVEDRRHYTILSDEKSVLTTQLYRTVPHEIGHWVDWLQRVERPSQQTGTDYSLLADAYWSRPAAEREAFAHAYADGLRQRWKAQALLPAR